MQTIAATPHALLTRTRPWHRHFYHDVHTRTSSGNVASNLECLNLLLDSRWVVKIIYQKKEKKILESSRFPFPPPPPFILCLKQFRR